MRQGMSRPFGGFLKKQGGPLWYVFIWKDFEGEIYRTFTGIINPNKDNTRILVLMNFIVYTQYALYKPYISFYAISK